ncbi:MAG: DUF2802 domain-containing protein [Pseudomonadales bacterium]|nr:DUF2802 domain-containing protein [Pseudomonadales bacterium]
MSTYFTDSFFYLLLAINASVICLMLISKVRRLQLQITKLENAYRAEVARLHKNFHGVLSRLQLAEEQIDHTAQRQDQIPTNKSVETNFNQATRLLDMGVDSEQLSHGFGLSEAEANLMSLIHKKQEILKDVA